MTSLTADVEEDFAARDVTVDGQNLPTQSVRAAAEASRTRLEPIGRVGGNDVEGDRLAIGGHQRQARASAVNSKIKAELHIYIRPGDCRVGRRCRIDQHGVRRYRTIEVDETRNAECQSHKQVKKSARHHFESL